jgi:hypothetical protein
MTTIKNGIVTLAALLISSMVGTNGYAASEQKLLFCVETVSYSDDPSICEMACSREGNVNPNCLSNEMTIGWRVVTATQKKVPTSLSGCSCGGVQYVVTREGATTRRKPQAKAPIGGVLQQLETYIATDKSETPYETYASRIRSGQGVPSKPLAFVHDVCIITLKEINPLFEPELATAKDVALVLDIYEKRDWRKIIGLRPLVHSDFVKSLSKFEKANLVKDVTVQLQTGAVTRENCGK